ncbi:hypothetical protein QFC21_003039 [Naganishia friedmannii]|uniref:Uncharacterized protein n=1 Tax=Naganishia friedmannii TaxID=89922 RepID=A0ACC2VSE2_9TREE|nr:hypothetical protein QFC21_003039 [Naganishia friedmannii]
MLRYYEVLLYTVIPPIALLGYLYSPLFGRRDGVKVWWLALMFKVTVGCILMIRKDRQRCGQHHGIIIFTLPYMIPYRLPQHIRNATPAEMKRTLMNGGGFKKVQTLRRRPWVATGWIAVAFLGFGLLFWPTTGSAGGNLTSDIWTAFKHILRHGLTLNSKSRVFYLGCILAWICPVIAFLTRLGANSLDTKGGRWTYVVGIGYLWMVDTIGIRSNAWHINEQTTLGINLWRGLPIEEAIFFVLTTHLILLSSSLISHLHHLLLFAVPPDCHPHRCPPKNPLLHIIVLALLALDRPAQDEGVLQALYLSEETLRKGSKSFTLAKLGWEREIRCGLVAVYGWCRITDNLIDEATSRQEAEDMLQMMKDFLHLVYSPVVQGEENVVNDFICNRVPEAAVPSFYLFSKLLPDIIAQSLFDELLQGYEMDLSFSSGNEGNEQLNTRRRDTRRSIIERSPFKTEVDMAVYADRVAGTVACMICLLAWAILDREGGQISDNEKFEILEHARQMGQALQLVNITRDIRTDALMRRLYIPLNTFRDRQEDLESLFSNPEVLTTRDWAYYTLPLLGSAYLVRRNAAPYIERLPRTARAGTRAMVASYFEIGKEIERRGGAVQLERLKVSKWRRIVAVSISFWGRGLPLDSPEDLVNQEIARRVSESKRV